MHVLMQESHEKTCKKSGLNIIKAHELLIMFMFTKSV